MSKVQTYYDQHAETEWARLDRFRTEFAVTLRALREHLPPPPASILDIGGGPGRYAIELARLGYTVTLADLSEASLALAQEKARAAGVALHRVLPANALDLSALPAATYDVVLLMGPLYHLVTAAERRQAVQEARRVLNDEGLIVAAVITRFAAIRDSAQGDPDWVLKHWDHVLQMIETGIQLAAYGFTDAYFARPEEVAPLLEAEGFVTLGVVGCEGVAGGHQDRINALTGEAWERWVDLNYRLGQDPALHGAADHLLYIGRNGSQMITDGHR